MPKYLYMVVVLILCCLILYCSVNKDPVKPEQQPEVTVNFLEFSDFGCQGNESSLEKPNGPGAYLKSYLVSNDTLTLRIHYSANCCPEFVDSVYVEDNLVEIALADILHGCRCTCDYENDFSFLYTNEGELRLLFKEWDKPGNSFTTLLDTTFTIIK